MRHVVCAMRLRVASVTEMVNIWPPLLTGCSLLHPKTVQAESSGGLTKSEICIFFGIQSVSGNL